MEELLQQILQECRPYTGQGALASYIPELARQDPDRLGIAVFHKDGNMVEAGAKEVKVFDHCCHNGAYEGSGVKEAVEKAGGVMVDGGNEGQYVQTENPKAKKFTSAKVHKAVLEADVYITCPPLKHHSGSEMTACMKNVMGTVWDLSLIHISEPTRPY